jgi:hypothetical protein
MGDELHKGAPLKNFFYCRENRKVSTEAEEMLWRWKKVPLLQERNLG